MAWAYPAASVVLTDNTVAVRVFISSSTELLDRACPCTPQELPAMSTSVRDKQDFWNCGVRPNEVQYRGFAAAGGRLAIVEA